MKSFLLFALFIGLQTMVSAQENKVMIPSPNAASLIGFSQIPVGKYTGTPSIQVPLYTITSGSLQLPVSLSYQASGIKVSQDASWVGLGWALNAGGVIGRSVRGQDDFGGNGPGYPGTTPFSGSYENGYWVYNNDTELQGLFSGNKDGEPDLFFFNFGKYSGKFYIDKQPVINGIYIATELDQKSNLRIQLFYDEKKFVITDGDGINYYFGTREYTYTQGAEVPGLPTNTLQLALTNYCDENRTISAWYLDKIASPNGDQILFQYNVPDACSGVASPLSISQSSYAERFFSRADMPVSFEETNLSRSVTEEVTLESITFKNGRLDFIGSPRTDVEGAQQYSPIKLDEIDIVRTTDNTILRTIQFSNSYFSGGTDGRLRLDAVYTQEKPYTFTYSSMTLPPKASMAIDHWGYYNGALNHNLLPYNTLGDMNSVIAENGGNREANADVIQAGILTDIMYPTGGSTHFDYEPNDFYNQGPAPVYEETLVQCPLSEYPSSSDTHFDFYVPEATTLRISGVSNSDIPCSCSIQPCSELTDPPTSQDVFGLLVSLTGEESLPEYILEDYFYGDVVARLYYNGCANNRINTTRNMSVSVPAGWYRLASEARYENSNTHLAVTYNKIVGYLPGIVGGGVRVKRITDIPVTGMPQVRRYIYRSISDASVSSGQLMAAPQYKSTLNITTFPTSYNVIRSNSFSPLSNSAQGAFVGYDAVTELFGENGENGKLVSTFINGTYQSFDFLPPVDIPFNGLPDNETTYNAAGDVLKVVKNNYDEYIPAGKQITGVVASTFPLFGGISAEEISLNNLDPSLPLSYLVQSYTISCSWHRLNSTTITENTAAGSMVNTTNYYYNSQNKMTSAMVTSGSGNVNTITKYKYPVDYNTSAGNVYGAMVGANIVNPPVEVQTWKSKNGVEALTASSVVEFKSYVNGKFFSPSKSFQLKTTTPLEASLVGGASAPFSSLLFNADYFDPATELDYDEDGRIIQQQKANDIIHAYVWGYNKAYPIAHVVNAKPADIFYTSFEEGDGNSSIADAKTGKLSYSGSYSKVLSGLDNGDYILSYWIKSGSTWTQQTIKVTVAAGAYTINLSGQLDEIRFYPAKAQMTTYTYDPLIGMTSQCDINDKVIYYEYDNFGRLALIRDQDKNILKKMSYSYAGQ